MMSLRLKIPDIITIAKMDMPRTRAGVIRHGSGRPVRRGLTAKGRINSRIISAIINNGFQFADIGQPPVGFGVKGQLFTIGKGILPVTGPGVVIFLPFQVRFLVLDLVHQHLSLQEFLIMST